jgi:uncharacterized protein (TIGR02646 family)
MAKVADALVAMSGPRGRCMFCEDSRGTDIDHVWPMIPYRERTFLWPNMLWLCGGCNRKKGNRFDLDAAGAPLLIDPTAEDPWDYLFFEPDTGMIVARVDPQTGTSHPKGEYTTSPAVLPLNIEAVTDGRRRTYRCLCRAVRRFLDVAHNVGDPSAAEVELLEEVRDHDDYGLLRWYFVKDGSQSSPFIELRRNHESAWRRIIDDLT